jgi:hypothetical protein
MYTNGEKFIGTVRDGKRDGNGVIVYSDQSTEICKFVAGQKHGNGYIYIDEKLKEVAWKNNKRTSDFDVEDYLEIGSKSPFVNPSAKFGKTAESSSFLSRALDEDATPNSTDRI